MLFVGLNEKIIMDVKYSTLFAQIITPIGVLLHEADVQVVQAAFFPYIYPLGR